MHFQVGDLSELRQVAKEWIALHPKPTVCLLNGEMGAGKTTFIKTICEGLGVTEAVSSPTFSLVNEYMAKNEKIIYHFDLYRLKSEDELYDMGFEEYLDQGSYVFIEWPEIAKPFFDGQEKKVKIGLENGARMFEFS